MTRQQFVSKFWPLAAEVGAQFGLAPAAILAHALKEAGANNARAAARHNWFGFMKAGKHLAYPDDRAGFTAYARRMSRAFPAAVAASSSPADFARAVAFSRYLNETADKKAAYAKSLAAIHRAVAGDVARLGMEQQPVARAGSPSDNVM